MSNTQRSSHFVDKWPEWKEEKMSKFDLSEEHFEFVCDSSFDFISECISNPTMPILKISGFGTLKPTIGKINLGLKSAFRWNKLGNKTTEELRNVVRRLWPVRNRLINEYYGEFTATNWHQYFKASAGGSVIQFIKNKYIKPRKKMPYKYKLRENKDITLNK